jgi:hypothetical protein
MKPGDARGGVGYLLLGQPALSSIVARALATKGDQPQYVEGRYELGLTALDLTDFEYQWLRRSQTFQVWASQAAVGAQLQAIQMIAGSNAGGVARNVISVIEEITILNENAASQRFHYGLSSNTNGVTSGPFFGYCADDRGTDGAGGSQSQASIGTQSNAGGAFTANRSGLVSILPGDSKTIRGPWILTGKPAGIVTETFCIQGGQSNIIVTAGIRWRERDLLASEQ